MIAHQIVDLVPDHVTVQRVHPQHHRLDDLFHDTFIGQRDIARAKTFAPASNALVSLNFDQMGGAFVIILLRIAQWFGQVIPQHMAGDAGDFHGFRPPNVVVSRARVIRFWTR